MTKVLVVEDDLEIAGLIREELIDAGHEVVMAKNGVEGLAAAAQHRPQVICCDVNMPQMNGLQLKKNLDQKGLLDDETRFIFVSAQASKSDVADGLMMGADKYITKPIDFDLLISLVGSQSN